MPSEVSAGKKGRENFVNSEPQALLLSRREKSHFKKEIRLQSCYKQVSDFDFTSFSCVILPCATEDWHPCKGERSEYLIPQ